jgi:hypothetical protein
VVEAVDARHQSSKKCRITGDQQGKQPRSLAPR